MNAAALYRRHPDLFETANEIVDRACNNTGKVQALWFVDGRWKSGPMDGRHYHRRGAHAVVAGVYACTAQPEHIVRDMLAVLDEYRMAA